MLGQCPLPLPHNGLAPGEGKGCQQDSCLFGFPTPKRSGPFFPTDALAPSAQHVLPFSVATLCPVLPAPPWAQCGPYISVKEDGWSFFIYFFPIFVLFLPGWWLLCSPSGGTPASPTAPVQLSLSSNSHRSPLLPEMSSASLISVLPF